MVESENAMQTKLLLEPHNYEKNPLFENLEFQNLDEKNFPIYQKDLLKIIWRLRTQLRLAFQQATKDNIIDPVRIDDILKWANRQCDFLKEFCDLLSSSSNDKHLSYRHIESIAHSYRKLSWQIKSGLSICAQKEYLPYADEMLSDLSKTSMKDLSEAIDKISHAKFKDDLFYEPEDFCPFNLTNDMVTNQLGLIKTKDIHIRNQISKNYNIFNHKEVFEIVMRNLLENAVKFTRKWGTIILDWGEETERDITFSVRNEWDPIPADFDVYKPGNTTPWSNGEIWTWLGLGECKSFLETINWSISHKNAPDWTWTIFTFTLPKKKTTSES